MLEVIDSTPPTLAQALCRSHQQKDSPISSVSLGVFTLSHSIDDITYFHGPL